MGRSLKEALLDQYALLQERGLAPSEMPQEDDAPLVVVESASRGRPRGARRDFGDRFGPDGEDILDGQFDRDRRRVQRRERTAGDEARERRRPAPNRGRGRPAELEPEFPAPAFGERPGLRGPRPPMAGAPRGPMRPGLGAPRPGAPGMGGPGRPPARTQMLQQRAEQRRREEEDIDEMRRLLAELKGQEMDDAAMDEFSRALVEETGALPPPRIVVEAIKESNSADTRKIGDAVRAYYRRRRPRPAMPAAAGAPAPREAAAASA